MDIREMKGIGDKTAALFEKLNIVTTEDLISYFPRDYEVFRETVYVKDVTVGEVCAVRCIIRGNVSLRYIRGMSIIVFQAADPTGELQVSIFNEPYMKRNLKSGIYYVFRGLIQKKGNRLVMEQPKCYKPDDYDRLTGVFQPVYHVTKGISSSAVGRFVRKAFEYEESLAAENSEGSCLREFLPEDMIKRNGLISHESAVRSMHFPVSREEVITARRRLVFEEFLIFLINIRSYKKAESSVESSYKMIPVADTGRLIEKLPYRLTDDQLTAWHDIEGDMSGRYAMNRLIQGDVGSGKTILAILALVMTAANGHQGSMMAPTEVLAEQHFRVISEMKEKYDLPLRPVLLTGSVPAAAKREIYGKLKDGSYNVIIGTHALIQDKAEYKDLALAVTDEQHRFGVRQRVGLSEKGNMPHIMVMSATPIPRTLAMILYGDLQISVIKQMPAGRKSIKNTVVGPEYRDRLYQLILREVGLGHQVYIICPMVEADEDNGLGLENVKDYAKRLRSAMPDDIRIGTLNGRMRPDEKTRVMEDFKRGQTDILVSTTVIEVGVNVPNATVMMIENAERFGLAQLHQLRGRVGRGSAQSYCIFVNASGNKDAEERLKVLTETNDGFEIASEDMKRRGPGDIFGIRQSGDMSFALADIYQDADILAQADRESDRILADDPGLAGEGNAALAETVRKMRERSMDMRSI
jgi:ATP-dependent DNA helicase RecG